MCALAQLLKGAGCNDEGLQDSMSHRGKTKTMNPRHLASTAGVKRDVQRSLKVCCYNMNRSKLHLEDPLLPRVYLFRQNGGDPLQHWGASAINKKYRIHRKSIKVDKSAKKVDESLMPLIYTNSNGNRKSSRKL